MMVMINSITTMTEIGMIILEIRGVVREIIIFKIIDNLILVEVKVDDRLGKVMMKIGLPHLMIIEIEIIVRVARREVVKEQIRGVVVAHLEIRDLEITFYNVEDVTN
uniref:Uncharacterized protein n=1 Tax=Photinus pyralis TaxID=7054 RepID=A0A1Y1L242_PHOPY